MHCSEPVFKDLNILDSFKIDDYQTARFISRFPPLNNLPDFFEKYFVTNEEIHCHSKEMHQNCINDPRGQIVCNKHCPTIELMYGIR